MGLSAGIMFASGTLANSYSQSEGLKAAGDFQRSQSEFNSRIATQRGQEAVEIGRADAATAKRRGDATAGSQKAAMAAQGLDVTDATGAGAIIEQTRTLSEIEQLNIKTNAWREAWGYKVAAANDQLEGDMADISARGQANQTLISGGMQAFGYGLAGYRQGMQPRTKTPVSGNISAGRVGNRASEY